jgi:hypothetical protein
MIERCFDAVLLNALVNDPAIRPDVGGDGESYLDLTAVLAEDRNVLLVGTAGGFLATWTAPETYEVHTFILPHGRGPQAFALAREGQAWMQAHGATHLWTRVDRKHRHTRLFTLRAGFKPCGEQTLDLGGGPTLYDLFSWRP